MNRSFQHPLDHMDAQLFSAGSLLPLPALRLLVPPLQLISASTWWVVQQRDVLHYWAVADFVSMVMESVPELLLHKHWTQLCLGLRAKYVLELCRTEGLPDADLVTSHLDKVKAPPPGQEVEVEVDEEEVERLRSSFVELVHTLLKDPDEKQNFFSEVFPVEFGALYDSDLQTLFWEFLCRLAQLLPTPDLQQTASWLGGVPTVLDDCVRSVSQPADLKTLLQHHKRLGSLEQHVPPSSMGDHILASLSSAPPHNRSRPSGLLQGDAPLDAAAALVEMVTVTDYAEVELGTSGEVPGLMGAQYFEGVEGRETKDEEEEESEGDPADTPPRAAAPVPLRPPSGLHDCPDCLKTFRFTSSLTAHRVVHTGERPHRCAHCGRSFSFRQSLDRHKHTHARHPPPEQQGAPEGGVNLAEKKEEPFVVALVPQLVDQVVSMVTVRTSGRQRKPSMKVRAMDSGEKAPAPRKRPAETAERPERPFNSSEHSYGSVVPMVTKHEAAAASSGSVPQTNAPPLQLLPSDGRFSCSDCDKSFRFRSLLLAHGRVHSGEQPYACTLCGRRFSFKQSLQRHQRTHGDGRQHPCPVCARRFSSLPACRRHQTVHADRHGEFPCTSCERTFRRKSTLVRHLKTHEQTGVAASTDLAPERPYACGCGKSFGHKAALAAHRRTHATERPHRCTQCDKAFLRRQGLRSHMRVHSPDMPFSCRFCGKRFKRQRNMRTHERGHTREGVFCCARCDRSFVYKATLTRHELMHSGERPFLCSDCGKRFLSHAELLKHQRFHSGLRPFSCDTCGRSFTQSCYLTLHLRRHSGVRPYACDDCGKSFLSADRLKRHRRTHTGERPYVCTVCGKRFGQSHHLKVHQRTHLHGSG